MFHLDPKSVAIGALVGFIVIPRVVALVQAKQAAAK